MAQATDVAENTLLVRARPQAQGVSLKAEASSAEEACQQSGIVTYMCM